MKILLLFIQNKSGSLPVLKENAILNGNSGSIGSRKLFDCEAKKGQFILLKDCRPDRRFEMEGTNSIL